MTHISKKKITVFSTILASGLLFGAALSIASCSGMSKTINPFFSSFEENDAYTNRECSTPTNISLLETQRTTGPTNGYGTNIDNGPVGYTGLHSFEYKATYINDQTRTTFSNYIYKDLNVVVGKDTEFSYKIFPNFADNSDDLNHNLNYLATYASVDLLYNDNATPGKLKSLSTTGIKDVNGDGISASEQGAAKCLFSYQWNIVKIDLKQLAGKHIHDIVINYDMVSPDLNAEYYGDKLVNPNETTNKVIDGFIDDISIRDKIKIDESSLTNFVDTRRGTDGHTDWSRGSTFPATALPHGFNFYTPLEHAKQLGEGNPGPDWLYDYKKFNNADNLPTLNGFGISHEPAPWMHDYDQFCVMPQVGNVAVKANDRSLAYSHDNEIARPDYYSVNFDNGIRGEMVPADHSAIFRFTFPTQVDTGRIIFDSLIDTGDSNRDAKSKDYFNFQDNTVSGWVENGAWGSDNYRGGQTRMFIYGEFSANFTHSSAVGDQGKDRQYCIFNLNNNRTIEFKFATSFIGLTQAQHNLDLEIKNEHLSFDQLHQRATDTWTDKLKAIDLSKSNATEEQKKIVYSNLYRLNLYPNESFENVSTKTDPIYKHVSSVLPTEGDATNTETNAQIFEGKTYVNNGFWDTYRTVWPLYCILYPEFINELIDGFLYQYLENGFVSRWSAPGDTDCMTGTSSDCAFANAYVNGTVTNINTAINIYKSGLADSFQYSSDPNTGRKGIGHSMYRGWTTSDDIDNGENMIDWDFQSWINDYALGQMAVKLSSDSNLTDSLAELEIGQNKQQIRDTGEYLLKRSQNYANLFDNSNPSATDPNENGFFRSKDDNGNWYDHESDDHYDARQWGYEYVEANGWNFAFTPVYDIDGLIGVYGGQNAFINKLDTFFSIPETGQHMGGIPSSWGVYSFTRETRDLRMGQLVMSNQPAHHIPYMYAEGGRPAKTQFYTREILHRMFTGSDIGQGYVGDEDNGEMSSWYTLSMLGLYDLALGKNQYVVTSPLFNDVTVHRDNGYKITIKTNDNSGNNIYIKSTELDGKSLDEAHIQSSSLLRGNHLIEYKMSGSPTTWGNKTINGEQRDLTSDQCIGNTLSYAGGTIRDVDNLTDGNSLTTSIFSGFTNNQATLTWTPAISKKINTLGLTSANSSLQMSITIQASHNDSDYTDLFELQTQKIDNPFDTRIYSFVNNTAWKHYRLIITSTTSTWELAEIQFI